MKIKYFIVGLLFALTTSSFAEDVSYQGYYVSRIIDKTTVLLERKNLLNPYSKTTMEWNKYWSEAVEQQHEGMLPIFPFFDFEQSFIYYCINHNYITNEQAAKDIEKSKHVGGLTSNDYNLLYLHAYLLSDLVLNKHISKEEAQILLDNSRSIK